MSVRQRLKDEKAAALSFPPLFRSTFDRNAAVVVALVAIALYAQSLTFGFVYDDMVLIETNKVTQAGFASVIPSFGQPFRFDNMIGIDELYRPLTKAIICMMYGFFGKDPMPFHALNILVHAVTGALVVAFVGNFFKANWKVAAAAGLLFVVHPIHTEVVCNIKSLDELLGLGFGVAGFLALLRHVESGRRGLPVGAMLFFLAALFSKESSITYLALFGLIFWTYSSDWRVHRAGFLGLCGVAGFFLLCRHAVIGGIDFKVSAADNAIVAIESASDRFASAVGYLGLYLKLLVFPYPLSADYSIAQLPVHTLGDIEFVLSMTLWAAIAGVGVWCAKRRSPIAFAWLALPVMMSVSSNLFVTIGTVFGERLAYSASLGIVCIVALGASSLLKIESSVLRTTIFVSLVAVLSTVGGAWTTVRSRDWRSFDELRDSMLMTSPNSFRVHNYYAEALWNKCKDLPESERDKKLEMIETSKKHLRRAAELYPRSDQAWTLLGDYERRAGNITEATKLYQKAIASEHTHPYYATALNNLGTFYAEEKRYDDAIVLFQKAAKFDKSNSNGFSNLGSCYYVKGNIPDAIKAFRSALEINPKDKAALRVLGALLKEQGNPEGEQLLRRAALP